MPRDAWLVVARRELIERVRSKLFVVITLLGPVFMVGVTVIPAVVAQRSGQRPARIAIVAHGEPGLAATVAEGLRMAEPSLEISLEDSRTSDDDLLGRIRARQLDGWLDLPADVLQGGTARYRGANAANLGAMARMQAGLLQAAIRARAEVIGLGAEQLLGLLRPVALEVTHTTGDRQGSSGTASFMLGYVVMLVLYTGILLYAINVMRSVILEKTSRVVEIVVSSVRPFGLMAGKIAGVGGVGLLQMSIWGAMGAVIVRFRGALLSQLGVTGAGELSIPPVGPGTMALLLGYFLLGYFLYAAMYAAVGAMCSSEQEAQQAQTPVVMLIIIPILFVQLVANDPRGPAAVAFTLVPFSSPVLMPMRFLLGGAPPLEIALSLLILAATVVGVTWVAARIYRTGILLHGKRPTLPELARWIRHG